MPEDTLDYDTVRIRNGPGQPRFEATRPGSNVVASTPIDDDEIDLRGVHIDECWVDNLDRYTVLVDGDTRVRKVHEYAVTPSPLTAKEEELYDMIRDRPRFPTERYDGSFFAYNDLKRDIVMDAERRALFGSLVQKDAIRPLDDHYVLINQGYGY